MPVGEPMRGRLCFYIRIFITSRFSRACFRVNAIITHAHVLLWYRTAWSGVKCTVPKKGFLASEKKRSRVGTSPGNEIPKYDYSVCHAFSPFAPHTRVASFTSRGRSRCRCNAIILRAVQSFSVRGFRKQQMTEIKAFVRGNVLVTRAAPKEKTPPKTLITRRGKQSYYYNGVVPPGTNKTYSRGRRGYSDALKRRSRPIPRLGGGGGGGGVVYGDDKSATNRKTRRKND